MYRIWPILPLLMTLLVGCSTSPNASRETKRDGQLRAFVTILPQADFVRKIAGERVAVDVLVGPGQSHHTYEPTARQMTALADSQIYFGIGVPCEHSLLPKIADMNRGLRIIDTSRDVKFRADASCAEHGHDHDAHDPHIWLDPRLVIIQAAHIRDGLAEIDPRNVAKYKKNFAEFERQLNELHAQLSAQLAPYKGREVLVFHPAYGYFTDAYGLKQLAVEQDGKEPAVKYLAGLIDQAKAAHINTVFIQPEYPVASADTIAAALRGKTVPLDPMTKDYLRDMREIARQVLMSFGDVQSSTAAVSP